MSSINFSARSWARGVALALGAVLLVGGGSASARLADRDTVPNGTVAVDGQQTPILGAFAYHQNNDDSNPEIRGLVHGVRRVEGGTVLYYSVGTPSGGAATVFGGLMAFPISMGRCKAGFAVDLRIFDLPGLVGYTPMCTDQTTFATDTKDLNGVVGDLRVGFAVFPELPAGVTSVLVHMPWGTPVADVPVEDGALLPVGGDPAPLLGQGWPKVPSGSELAGANRAEFTYPLSRRSGNVAGTATTEESPKQVATTLNANVLFATSSAELSGEAQGVLATVAADIRERGTGQVVVTGHTDSDGSDASNQVLSENRANSVLAALQPASGPDVTFVAVGKGESEPVASNGSAEGKQQNRRVTVVYSVKGGS